MITVNGSTSSLNTINQLSNKKEEEDGKLASGKRINSAADDPAGLQIANRLTSQINGDAQLSVNAQDQINLNNTQEAGLSAINDSLQRANELSIQSGNPLADQGAIQAELNQITEEINAVAGDALGDSSFAPTLDASDPAATQDAINASFDVVSEQAAALGAASNGLSSQVSTYETSVVNVSASRSRIQDTDFAQTTSEQQQVNTLLQASITAKKDDEEARKGILINQLI